MSPALKRQRAVLGAGDLAERGALLALAAGADQHEIAARDVGRFRQAEEGCQAVQVTAGAGGFLHPQQRAAGEHDLAVVDGRGFGDGLHAGDVAGEAGHRDGAPAAPESLGETGAGLALGAGGAFDLRIGAVAHHGEHALVTQALQGLEIGGLADQRFRIELPVAGVQEIAGTGADGERNGFRDRVGDRDGFDIERTDRGSARRPGRC